MAVKNSSCESAKLLLERGVQTGAKANVRSIHSVSVFSSRPPYLSTFTHLICLTRIVAEWHVTIAFSCLACTSNWRLQHRQCVAKLRCGLLC
jgi:hypothetical protein